MRNLVMSWREQWSVVPNTTDPVFPFGIVSLAAGTSEGHGPNMANFRHAQTASYGILPGPPGSGMEKTFVAQAYDAGDPVSNANPMYRDKMFAPLYQGQSRADQVDMPYVVLLCFHPRLCCDMPLCCWVSIDVCVATYVILLVEVMQRFLFILICVVKSVLIHGHY